MGKVCGANTLMESPVIGIGLVTRLTFLDGFIPELEGFTLDTFLSIPVRMVGRAVAGGVRIGLLVKELGCGSADQQQYTENHLDSFGVHGFIESK